jgi:hypothetical protein
VVTLADKVNHRPIALSDLYVFSARDRELGPAHTAAEQDRYHSDILGVAWVYPAAEGVSLRMRALFVSAK